MKTDAIRRNYELYQRLSRAADSADTTDTDCLIRMLEAMEPWSILPVRIIQHEKGGDDDDGTKE